MAFKKTRFKFSIRGVLCVTLILGSIVFAIKICLDVLPPSDGEFEDDGFTILIQQGKVFVSVSDGRDVNLVSLSKFRRHIVGLELLDTTVSSSCASWLGNMPKLRNLVLADCEVPVSIKRLLLNNSTVTSLCVRGIGVDDQDIESIQSMRGLVFLDISKNALDYGKFCNMARGLEFLSDVWVVRCSFSVAQLKELEEWAPNKCKIYSDKDMY